jgi:hypothetical protein
MAFCTKCGKELTDGAKFCASCGTSAEGTVSEPKTAAKKESVLDKLPTAEAKEKLNAGKEKVNAGINKLPFKKLAEEKIPASARAKFPILDNLIPFANQIVCGLAVLAVVVTVAAASSGSKNSSKSVSDVSQNLDTDFMEESELMNDLDLWIPQTEEYDEELQRILDSPQFINRDRNNQTNNSNQADNATGTFILTDLMSLNGKYVYLFAYNSNENLIGCQSVDMRTKTITLSQITRGSVNLPMWILNNSNNTSSRYYSNGTFNDIGVAIFNTSTIKFENNIDEIRFSLKKQTATLNSMSLILSDTLMGLAERGSLIYVIELSETTFSNGNAIKDMDEGISFGLTW